MNSDKHKYATISILSFAMNKHIYFTCNEYEIKYLLEQIFLHTKCLCIIYYFITSENITIERIFKFLV